MRRYPGSSPGYPRPTWKDLALPVKLRKLSVIACVLSAAALSIPADRWLSRADKAAFDVAKQRLLSLRDSLLLFRLDHGRFPEDLDELVPAYAAEDATHYCPGGDTSREASFTFAPRSCMLSGASPFRIAGLLPRARALSVQLPKRPLVRDPLNGKRVFAQEQKAVRLSDDAIVVEAEHFQYLTYGWEIGQSQAASGGAHIHLKEGIGDLRHDEIIFDPARRAGDFYNVTRDMRPIEARCYFAAPAAGTYFMAVRTMAHRSSCSNIIRAAVGGQVHSVGNNGTEPFAWLWHCPGTVLLEEGANAISFYTYQDDVKVDQIVFTRAAPSFPSGSNTIFEAASDRWLQLPDEVPPATLSLSASSLTLTEESDPRVDLYLRRNTPGPLERVLKMALDLPAGRRRERSYDVTLEPPATLVKFPYDLDLPRPLEKREYLLRYRLLAGSDVEQERTLVLMHGYDWSVLGPLPYMTVDEKGAPEGDQPPKKEYDFGGRTFTWRAYDEQHTDQFGIMDFGRMFCGRTYDALPNVTLYAYTEMDAARGGDYRLKAQGDDHLVVWINGAHVLTIAEKKVTAIRSATERIVTLDRGRNTVLFRLNQGTGQWQAAIRFRTKDDQVAAVRGIPFEKQAVAVAEPRLPTLIDGDHDTK